jgi:hypothetical protein
MMDEGLIAAPPEPSDEPEAASRAHVLATGAEW